MAAEQTEDKCESEVIVVLQFAIAKNKTNKN